MKYMKVMFGTISAANSELKYKLDEINVTTNWNPSVSDPKEMGGFNFSCEDKIIRWLVRGDTLYDVIIPDDAEVINCVSESAPHGVFRTNKIILTNPRYVTDEIAIELYKKSNLPEKSYFKTIAGLVIRGRLKTADLIIKEKINKGNIDLAISEYEDFYMPEKKDDNEGHNNYMLYLNRLKELRKDFINTVENK